MYKLYVSKLNPNCDYLWQKPRQGRVNYIDSEWFEARRVGHNTVEYFMKTLIESANLQGKEYTNHSIRSTCITNLDKSVFEGRHITSLSGHKSESTIKDYSVKCPVAKSKEMFAALATKIEPSASVPTTPNQQVPNFSIQIPKINQQDLQLNNLDLLEMDNADDALLSDILTQTERQLENSNSNNNNLNPAPMAIVPQTNTVNHVQNNNNFNPPPLLPMVPKMYFPHSNVTINYNFK